MKWLKLLYVLMPLAVLLYLGKYGICSFMVAVAAMAIISIMLGISIGQYRLYVGPFRSALLNSFVGNIAELIIATLALILGNTELVRGSIIGSMIGNLLVVIGACYMTDLRKGSELHFNKTFVQNNVSVLYVVALVMLFPSLLSSLSPITGISVPIRYYSIEMAVLLIIVYIVLMIENNTDHSIHRLSSGEKPIWSKNFARFMVLLSAALAIIISYILVKGVEEVSLKFGINQVLLGMFLIPSISNTPENSSAVRCAFKNDGDMAMAIPLASSIQVSLFVAPLVVFVGLIVGHPFYLNFSLIHVVITLATVFIVDRFTMDGRARWFRGFIMIMIYLAAAFAALHFGK
jgi:Ca2+:H+ antiporter